MERQAITGTYVLHEHMFAVKFLRKETMKLSSRDYGQCF